MKSPAHYLFAYGSLLSPVSLLSTLPDVDVDAVAVARLLGHRRAFDVAFPNDGSQLDKAYFDEAEERPPFVLFSNVTQHSSYNVNGVLVPVSQAQLEALRERERRYRLVSCGTSIDAGPQVDPEQIVTFVGADAFTVAEDVYKGVVAQSYMELLTDGALFWEQRHPGFLDAFHSSTQMPIDAVAALRRVNLRAPTG